MSVRVRFAPSPTGHLHIGGARTALFNYLFAKKHKGTFVLRVEDTDQDRHQEESLIPLLQHLKWLGLDWDEGPVYSLSSGQLSSKGSYAPYRQKERLEIYKAKALELINNNKAYYCFMTKEEEAEQKKQALESGQPFRVSSPYRDLSLAEAQKKIEGGASFCIRFKTESRSQNYLMKDLVRGDLSFPHDSLGDFILIRSDGFPVYNFSCAVDDGLMKISHVFRGEEHLSNSLKQQLIQKALAFVCPQIGHLSIILDKDKKKLSKRAGAESLEYYKKEAYLPSALINFLSLLGWNPKTDQELFYKEELIESFNVSGLNASAAVFDPVKLLWLNEQHIKKMSDLDLRKAIQAFRESTALESTALDSTNLDSTALESRALLKKEDPFWDRAIPLLRSQFKTLKQALDLIVFVFRDELELSSSAQQGIKESAVQTLIKNWLMFLENLDKEFLDIEDLKAFQKSQAPVKGKNLFQPLRLALIGQTEGLEIKVLIQLLSRKQMISRAKSLIEK